MQRQRGELVPIGDALSGMDGPVKAIREATPQALRHFTQADQVNQLVSASEADADLGFMARLLVLCSLPRTNPGNRHQYKRQNGPYTLIMYSSGRCCMIQLRRAWGRFSNFSFRTPQRRISAYPARPSG